MASPPQPADNGHVTRSAQFRPPTARPPRRDVHAGAKRPWRRPRLPFPPIVAGFFLTGMGLTALVAWLLVARFQAGALVAYLAGVNIVTLAAYLYDKAIAASGAALWRVPEASLHLLALAGGTPGAFAGQRLLRHKTRKEGFRAWFWVIVALQAALLVGWLWGSKHRANS